MDLRRFRFRSRGCRQDEERCRRSDMRLYCCQRRGEVDARLTDGGEIYPHKPDLCGLPFWKCDGCGNYVGCHHKTQDRTRPLGNIPNKAMREARKHIHRILDPLWKATYYYRVMT